MIELSQCASASVSALSIDLVGFSLHFDQAQARRVVALQKKVRASVGSLCPPDTITVPTGDGVIVVQPSGTAVAMISLARHISRSITDALLSLPIRIGISEGNAFIVSDLFGTPAAIGDCINSCVRVMELGDEGHILLTESAFSSAKNDENVSRHLKKLARNPVRVKHGVLHHVFNYHDGVFGVDDDPGCVRESTGITRSSIGRQVTWQDIIHTSDELRMIGNSIPMFGEPAFLDALERLIGEESTAVEVLLLNPISPAFNLRSESRAYDTVTELSDTFRYTYKILKGFRQRLSRKFGEQKSRLLDVRLFEAAPTFTAFILDNITFVNFYVEHLSGSRGPYFSCVDRSHEGSLSHCIDASFTELWERRSISIYSPDFIDQQTRIATEFNDAFASIEVPKYFDM